jgi:hypothetical protein
VDRDIGSANESHHQAGYKRHDPKAFDASGDLLDRSGHTHPVPLAQSTVAA